MTRSRGGCSSGRYVRIKYSNGVEAKVWIWCNKNIGSTRLVNIALSKIQQAVDSDDDLEFDVDELCKRKE